MRLWMEGLEDPARGFVPNQRVAGFCSLCPKQAGPSVGPALVLVRSLNYPPQNPAPSYLCKVPQDPGDSLDFWAQSVCREGPLMPKAMLSYGGFSGILPPQLTILSSVCV